MVAVEKTSGNVIWLNTYKLFLQASKPICGLAEARRCRTALVAKVAREDYAVFYHD